MITSVAGHDVRLPGKNLLPIQLAGDACISNCPLIEQGRGEILLL
jgi:hypothetical protein